MRAAWYERGGPASEVLTVGEMEDPWPGAGEVLVRVYASGVNPGDVNKRADWIGLGVGFPRVIPHSDGEARGGGRMYASFAREHPELAGRLRRGETDSGALE
jgi:hypothetical protein